MACVSVRVAALGALMTPSFALAQTLTTSFDLDGAALDQVGLQGDDVEQALGGTIEQDLRLGVEGYLAQMAEAAAFSTKGMGVDYASNPKKVVLGVGFGVAATTEDGLNGLRGAYNREDELLPTAGFATQASLMGGVNLGFLKPGDDGLLDRFTVYGNLLYARPSTEEEFQATFSNFGVHVQAAVLKPVRAGVAKWGGLSATTGLERSTYSLRLVQDLPLLAGAGANDAPLRWDTTGDFTLRSGTWSVPLELSTNIRILVLTAFGGGAVDLIGSRASIESSLGGDIIAQDGDGNEVRLGTGTATLEARDSANPFSGRAFGGLQLDVLMVKLFVQANLGTNNRYGAHAGLRVAL